MGKFIIQPHGRLQEWIAHEKGYFRDEGLDYEFVRGPSADTTKSVDASGKVTDLLSGAFESYKHAGGNKGVKSDISCACHWAVNQASSHKIGTMWGKSYVVTPGGVMVPPDSKITRPEDLAGQEIAVGYHSGSHFTTIQSLEPFLTKEQIKLGSAVRSGHASTSASAAIARGERLGIVVSGFGAVGSAGLDASFAIAFMFRRRRSRRCREIYERHETAQMELDFAPKNIAHYLNEIRIVTRRRSRPVLAGRTSSFCRTPEMYAKTQAWIHERGLFEGQARRSITQPRSRLVNDRAATLDTPVLIAGGGPIGLALAADLGRRGVATLLVEERENKLNPAKMLEVSVRTMEFCRQLGIVGKVRNWGFPADWPLDSVFVTNLQGYELGRVRMPALGVQTHLPVSPERGMPCPQTWFDPILQQHARSFPRDVAAPRQARKLRPGCRRCDGDAARWIERPRRNRSRRISRRL